MSQERKQIYKSPLNSNVFTMLKQHRPYLQKGNLNDILHTLTSNNEIVLLVSSDYLLFYRNSFFFFCSFSSRLVNSLCVCMHICVCMYIGMHPKQVFFFF